MRLRSVIVLIFFLSGLSTLNIDAQTKAPSAENVLRMVNENLAKLKTLSYTFRRELNYESTGFVSNIQIESFLDLTPTEKIIGARFQFDEPNYIFIFNGSEYFLLNKKTKKITIKKKPAFQDFESLPGFYDSLVTLKNSLPSIISDKTIPKTISTGSIANKSFYIVEFVLDSKILTLNGEYFVTTPRKFTYRLTIDSSTLMPVSLARNNSVNSDFTRTSFEYKDAKTAVPGDSSWFYSTYLSEYEPEKPRENKLIKVGQDSPKWELPDLKDDALVSSAQYKDKVVLIEFWISFCGYCIAAVPKLNQIEEKYRSKEFKLVAINASDRKDIIQKFEKNNQTKFQILYDGQAIADSYGVDGFPTIVLIGKTGKVLYAGGFDPNDTVALEKLIDENL